MTLLMDCYQDVMGHMMGELFQSAAITIGVDGATNGLSRSMSNVIVHDPKPWFVEYLRTDLKKETALQVSVKIKAVVGRLDCALHKALVHAFVSDS